MNVFVINQDMTLKDALVQIEKNKHRSLIVVNDAKKVVGTLSDGDIRKALIQDTIMSIQISKLMNRDFIYINDLKEIDRVDEYFNKKNIFIVPVVDNNFKLIDILVKD